MDAYVLKKRLAPASTNNLAWQDLRDKSTSASGGAAHRRGETIRLSEISPQPRLAEGLGISVEHQMK